MKIEILFNTNTQFHSKCINVILKGFEKKIHPEISFPGRGLSQKLDGCRQKRGWGPNL